jgi:putative peptide maturation dehydrogenase
VLLHRPQVVVIERRDAPEFSFEDLLAGGAGVVRASRWVALAPHLAAEVVVDLSDLEVLEAMPAKGGVELEQLAARFGQARVARLRQAGLLLGQDAAHAPLRARDQALRATAWWPLAAVMQAFTRWDGVDVGADEARRGARTLTGLVAANGLPPPAAGSRGDASARLALPAVGDSALDRLLAARSTCRNFEARAALSREQLAALLGRVFGAQATAEPLVGVPMLKKHSPSGGGLHPIEAYLLVQRVEALAPGLYHYHALAHALEPMRALAADEAASCARELVAGQDCFADAPVLVLLAARFQRNFWKYRQHAKAWKVIQLDAGHLSQTWQLCATELRLGSFITAAINDACAERLFDLDGITEGAIAICGAGPRAAQGTHFEFDPLGKAVR